MEEKPGQERIPPEAEEPFQSETWATLPVTDNTELSEETEPAGHDPPCQDMRAGIDGMGPLAPTPPSARLRSVHPTPIPFRLHS